MRATRRCPAVPEDTLRDGRPNGGGLPGMRSEFSVTLSGPGDEIGRESRLDIVGYLLGSTIFSVAETTRPRKSLGLPRNVIGHTGKRGAGDYLLAALDFRQGVVGVEAIILDVRTAAGDIHDDRHPVRRHPDREPMGRRRGLSAAGEVE